MTRPTTSPTVGVLLLVALLGACGQGEPDSGTDASVAIDTVGGVPHVVSGSRGRWAEREAWRVEVDDGVVIGEVDGREAYTFGQVAGVVVGEDGRIYVGDAQNLEVRVFSGDGELETRFGREGEGPGEFRNISGVSRAPGGVAVLDGMLGRVTVFAPRGEIVRSFRLERPYMILEHFALMRFDDGGRFYDRARLASAVLVDTVGVLIYSASGEPVDTVRVAAIEQDHLVVERDGRPVMSFPRPFAPRPSLAVGPEGRIHFTRGGDYRILVLSPRGDTLRMLRRELEPPSVTPEERDSARASVEERFREAAGSAPPRDLELPDTKPLISGLLVDRAGNLWVQRGSAAGRSGREWDVHGPDGVLLGSVEMPAMAVADIGVDYVAGVRYDELGVPRVAVYPLVKP